MRKQGASLLAELARSRRAVFEPQPWVPTDEQIAAIAAGDLIAIPIRGGPCILINLAVYRATTP